MINDERSLLGEVLLSMLPSIQREIVVMVFYHDYKVSEVGAELNLSTEQVAELMGEAFATMRAGRKVMAVKIRIPLSPPISQFVH